MPASCIKPVRMGRAVIAFPGAFQRSSEEINDSALVNK